MDKLETKSKCDIETLCRNCTLQQQSAVILILLLSSLSLRQESDVQGAMVSYNKTQPPTFPNTREPVSRPKKSQQTPVRYASTMQNPLEHFFSLRHNINVPSLLLPLHGPAFPRSARRPSKQVVNTTSIAQARARSAWRLHSFATQSIQGKRRGSGSRRTRRMATKVAGLH